MRSDGGPPAPLINRFEVLLWVIGALLIAVATIACWYAATPQAPNVCSGGDCTVGSDYMIRQLTYFVMPGALTGGIVCLGMALAVRALTVSFGSRLPAASGAQDDDRDRAQGRAGDHSRDHDPDAELDEFARPSGVPSGVWRPGSDDHRIFMRPGE